MDGSEDRQRVDRWIEETQYLVGRIVPALLDDRDRLKARLGAAEEESSRLRQEVSALKKEIADHQNEAQHLRGEHLAIAETLSKVLDHLGHVQKPLTDVYRRIQVTQAAEQLTG